MTPKDPISMKPYRSILMFLALVLAAGLAIGAAEKTGEYDIQREDVGPEKFVLEGGEPGGVPFPHRAHQDALDQQCEICHELFPQHRGAIQELVAEEKLRKKEVMNLHCIKCHRDYKREGKPSGPTSCRRCHSAGEQG
jgi:hypothetical protein